MEHRQEALQRIRTVEGHIRGIQKMIQADADCSAVISQLRAVQSALNKISLTLIDGHINRCLLSAVEEGCPEYQEQMIEEIFKVFSIAAKR